MSEPLPRLLLVEDDPVSAAFLAGALATVPLRLDLACSMGEALSTIARRRPALALLDLQLPDGDGVTLLQSLRGRGLACPAIALTADPQARLDGALARAGFVALAHKPLAAVVLRRMVAEWLPLPAHPHAVAEPPLPAAAGRHPEPVWDETAALAAAGGRAAIVAQLRALLRRDLPGQCAALQAALSERDSGAALSLLHRLQGAAAFCGAARLAAAAQALERTVRGRGDTAPALQELLAASAAVLDGPAVPA